MGRTPSEGIVRWTLSLTLLALVTACSPVESGPPDMMSVEDHLSSVVGYLPEGCVPIGLDGDGRGGTVGAAFDCGRGTTLRIERFDDESDDDPVPDSPAESAPGRVEWRDPATGDVIRVSSDDLPPDVLLKTAEAIEIRE